MNLFAPSFLETRVSYSDFDGKFIILYDKSLINDNSKFEIMYEGYSKKVIAFSEFPEGKTIILDKKSKIVEKDQYMNFYESIRSCTR